MRDSLEFFHHQSHNSPLDSNFFFSNSIKTHVEIKLDFLWSTLSNQTKQQQKIKNLHFNPPQQPKIREETT